MPEKSTVNHTAGGGDGAAWLDSGNRAWHLTESEEAVRLLEADLERGLSSEAAAKRLAQVGPNRLPPRLGRGC